MSKEKILVCGGAGYIGSHVVRELMASDWTPIIVDDLSEGHNESVPDSVELIVASIGDRQKLQNIFEHHDISAVVHLCANAYVGESVSNPLKYYQNNISNGLVLLESMIAHNVRKMVFSSSCAVYGYPDRVPVDEECSIGPISPYGHTKSMYEQILSDFSTAYGLKYVALRYFNASGAHSVEKIGEDHRPEPHLIPLVIRQVVQKMFPDLFKDDVKQLHLFGNDYGTLDGTCIRDYIHVMDLASAHRLALDYLADDNQSVALNLGNEKGYSVLDIISTCEEVTDSKIEYQIVQRRPGDPDELIADSSKARELLGWKPVQSDIRSIAKTAWEWHKSHPLGY